MSKPVIGALALAIFWLGAASGYVLGEQQAQTRIVLENDRVEVEERVLAPGARREPHRRPTDQVIVFLDEATYDAIDASGKGEARRRRAGEVIWHNKGEAAPLLVNTGSKPFRSVTISLKRER